MSEHATPGGARRFLDTTINVQSLMMAMIGAVIAITLAYFTLISRVDRLEAREQGQDDRMSRMEVTQTQQRNETAQQLRDISNDIKDMRNLLMSNAAASRPDIKRWAR